MRETLWPIPYPIAANAASPHQSLLIATNETLLALMSSSFPMSEAPGVRPGVALPDPVLIASCSEMPVILAETFQTCRE